MRIAFVTPEVFPFSKTGGLADVSGALPLALARRGHKVRVITPWHRQAALRDLPTETLPISFTVTAGRPYPFGVRRGYMGPVQVDLLVCDPLFDRDPPYGNTNGAYPDNAQRFAAFSRAALALFDHTGWPEIVHGHDWQCGLLPVLLKQRAAGPRPGTVHTIHNLAYQGNFPAADLSVTGLGPERFHPGDLEFWGGLSFLKAALVHADHLTTVSPTYAREIQGPVLGHGMEGVLKERAGHLTGILNGIDEELWNPATDPHLNATYDRDDLSGKRACRVALRDELELTGPPDRLLVGLIARLVWQKGIDLVIGVGRELLARPVELVILGDGDPGLVAQLQALAKAHPGRVRTLIGYDEALAHRLEAGLDAFLMPSRYEPCGMNQLYSMRYGTPPIVHRVGGLADTVQDPREVGVVSATGFHFDGFDGHAFLGAVDEALRCFRHPERWTRLMRNGMAQEVGWGQSAAAYEGVYRSVWKLG